MPFLKRYFILLTITATITGLTTSCAEGKISQCNKIIQVANQAFTEAKSVSYNIPLKDSKPILQAADVMEKAYKEMKAIKIQDEKLQDYQLGFINMYRNINKAMHEYAVAVDRKDLEAARKAEANIQQATAPEKQLVNDLNRYCSVQQ